MINKAIRLVSFDGYSSYTKSILVGFEVKNKYKQNTKNLMMNTKKPQPALAKKRIANVILTGNHIQ